MSEQQTKVSVRGSQLNQSQGRCPRCLLADHRELDVHDGILSPQLFYRSDLSVCGPTAESKGESEQIMAFGLRCHTGFRLQIECSGGVVEDGRNSGTLERALGIDVAEGGARM